MSKQSNGEGTLLQGDGVSYFIPNERLDEFRLDGEVSDILEGARGLAALSPVSVLNSISGPLVQDVLKLAPSNTTTVSVVNIASTRARD